MYAELETSNHLGESLHAAQERTSELMESLLAGGCRTTRRGSWRGSTGRFSRARRMTTGRGHEVPPLRYIKLRDPGALCNMAEPRDPADTGVGEQLELGGGSR